VADAANVLASGAGLCVLDFHALGKHSDDYLEIVVGALVLTFSITATQCASKSSASAFKAVSLILLREPFARPLG
jgi:hypothetical protein